MNKDNTILLWTEENDNEGETWNVGIIPETEEDNKLFIELKNKMKILLNKYQNEEYALTTFNGNLDELKSLVKYSDVGYYAYWSMKTIKFSSKFELLDTIVSNLLKNDKTVNLVELKESISNSNADKGVKTDLLNVLDESWKNKTKTTEINYVYSFLLDELAYKLQIFD